MKASQVLAARTVHVGMSKLQVLVAFTACVLSACSGAGFSAQGGWERPQTYSVDPAFDAAQAAVIDDAFAAWCVAKEYCPVRTEWTDGSEDGAVVLSENYADYNRSNPNEVAMNCGRVVLDARRTDVLGDLDLMWRVIAHEIGHYGIPAHAHTHTGVMASPAQPGPLKLDAISIAAWK